VLVLTPLSSPSLVTGSNVEGLAPLKVRFGLCRSGDPDPGDSLSFKWYWGDPYDPPYLPGKPNQEGETPGGPCYAEHTYPVGKYTATVTVSDRHLEDQGGNVGSQALRTQTVNINAYPAPPNCVAPTSTQIPDNSNNPFDSAPYFSGADLTYSFQYLNCATSRKVVAMGNNPGSIDPKTGLMSHNYCGCYTITATNACGAASSSYYWCD